jgi:protein required for attachment to host cells
MSAICVLVADNYRARIFEAESRKGNLRELQTILCPEARLFARELGTDTPSSALNSSANHTGQSRHRTGDKTDNKHQQSVQFASDIVSQLKKLQITHPFSNLILTAPPKFLGTLRKKLDNNLRNCISFELDKELTQLSADEIRDRLPVILPRQKSTVE